MLHALKGMAIEAPRSSHVTGPIVLAFNPIGGSFTFTQTNPTDFLHLVPGTSGSTIEQVIVGSGGNGSIASGVLMDPQAQQITPFDGSVYAHVNFMGVNSNLTLGAIPTDDTHYSYAFCDAI